MPTCPNCYHTFTEDTPLGGRASHNRNEYGSFDEMVEAILATTRATRLTLESKDDPRMRQVGFETSDGTRRWAINLTRIKEGLTGPRGAAYGSYLRSTRGRELLATLWSRGQEPTEPFSETPA